nr:MAG TPA: hypothetical protein [Caudoviricetes sp.]
MLNRYSAFPRNVPKDYVKWELLEISYIFI